MPKFAKAHCNGNLSQMRKGKPPKACEGKVNEIFETIQGEGSYTGTPAIFVRLQGCPVGCAWCDTKHTWEINTDLLIQLGDTARKKADSEHFADCDAQGLLQLIRNQGYRARHVVITGGEPCLYDLNPL
ncbi:MAG: 4Fe-4S cluster-binding domain-containing protein [Rheinheimera sp.]|nr:4Fe-4S cluster-binding domain-containing protein [Rheinheimera sp.]